METFNSVMINGSTAGGVAMGGVKSGGGTIDNVGWEASRQTAVWWATS